MQLTCSWHIAMHQTLLLQQSLKMQHTRAQNHHHAPQNTPSKTPNAAAASARKIGFFHDPWNALSRIFLQCCACQVIKNVFKIWSFRRAPFVRAGTVEMNCNSNTQKEPDAYMFVLAEGSLEVELPTYGQLQQQLWEQSEKRKRQKRKSQKRKSQRRYIEPAERRSKCATK